MAMGDEEGPVENLHPDTLILDCSVSSMYTHIYTHTYIIIYVHTYVYRHYTYIHTRVYILASHLRAVQMTNELREQHFLCPSDS